MSFPRLESLKGANSKGWHGELGAGPFAHPGFRVLLLSSFGLVSNFGFRVSNFGRSFGFVSDFDPRISGYTPDGARTGLASDFCEVGHASTHGIKIRQRSHGASDRVCPPHRPWANTPGRAVYPSFADH